MTAWLPLRHRAFRALWLASFFTLTGSWIADSTAAWLMTSLSASPLMVALVSSAITLPVLLMALPAGAVADLFDRRMVLMVTQCWVTVVSLALFAVSIGGKMTAELLLALTFAHGIGSAIRLPLVAAMTPGLVPLDPPAMEADLNNIAGLVTNGIFACRPADVLLLGDEKGVKTILRK